jgi:hypothetical protein
MLGGIDATDAHRDRRSTGLEVNQLQALHHQTAHGLVDHLLRLEAESDSAEFPIKRLRPNRIIPLGGIHLTGPEQSNSYIWGSRYWRATRSGWFRDAKRRWSGQMDTPDPASRAHVCRLLAVNLYTTPTG